MIETSSVHPRKSSEIFGNLRKISENVRKRSPYLRNNFGESSEIFGKWSEIFGKSSKTSSLVCLCQEGGVNTSDLADPMMTAIMTSQRKKRANAQNFRKWRPRPSSKQLFGAGFSTHWNLKLCCVFVERCNYYLSLLRGKWNSEYDRKIMRKVYLKCFCPCPMLKII